MSYGLDLGIEVELFRDLFTLLLVAKFIVIKPFVVIYFLFLEQAWLQYFWHHLLGLSHSGFIDLFESLLVGFDLLLEVVDKFFQLLNGPIIEIDVFGLIFYGSHKVHETLGVESSFEDLVSEEDLFLVFWYLVVLHVGLRGFEIKSEKIMLKLSN